MIRDPGCTTLEHSVTEEVETGMASEQDQNGGLRANK